MAGTATCSGEGGMIPDERRYSDKWFYQCIQSRYGFNPNHLRLAFEVRHLSLEVEEDNLREA
jgi:glutamate synthase domain-containing protein 2